MIGEALKDFLRYLPSRVLPALAAVAAIPVLTRLLPPAEYGRYTLAVNAVALFSALVSAWITASAIRFIPIHEKDDSLGEGYGLLLGLFLSGLAVGTAVAAGAGLVLASRGVVPMAVVIVALLLCFVSGTNHIFLGLLRSRRRASQFTTLTSIAGPAGYALAIAMALLVVPTAPAVLGGFLAATVLVLPASARLALRGIRPVMTSLRSPEAREMLRYGAPALMVNALTWLTSLSDRYILAASHGEHTVGIYAASRDLSDKPLALLNTLFLLASTPVGIRAYEDGGEEAARAYVVNLTRFYLLIAMPAAAGIAVLGRPMITVLADPRYHSGYPLVPFVAAGALFAGLAARYTLGLTFRKRNDLFSICYGGAALASVGLNLVFVPRFGYMAAAAANMASYAILLLVARIVSRPYFDWRFPWATLLRVAAATAAMVIVVRLFIQRIDAAASQVLAGIIVGVVVYGVALLAVGGVTKKERAWLARVLGFSERESPPEG